MNSGRSVGLKRRSYGIVLIGQNAQLRKRIAFVLRGAGFRIAASVSDVDLAFFKGVPREDQIISIFEVNDRFEKTSRHVKLFRTLYPMGGLVLMAIGDLRHRQPEIAFEAKTYLISAATDLMLAKAASPVLLVLATETHTNRPRAFRDRAKGRHLTRKKGRRSVRAERKGANGMSDSAALTGAVVPAASAGECRPTARQAMILKSLMNGDSNKVVARRLRIAEGTVKVHIKLLLRKIGAKNRTQAAIWALNNNFEAGLDNETGNPRPAPREPQLSRSRGRKSKKDRNEHSEAQSRQYH